jgi:pimeloyl-ACP methyl ester carboxylesterase
VRRLGGRYRVVGPDYPGFGRGPALVGTASLAQQATDDALTNILARLDEFRGLSRFTKNLFDARGNLRARMDAAGHPVHDRVAA